MQHGTTRAPDGAIQRDRSRSPNAKARDLRLRNSRRLKSARIFLAIAF